MDLWIYSKDGQARLGLVDTASSIIWTDRYRQCGDFEIYIQATAKMLGLLEKDRIVVNPGRDMAGIIEKVEITTDEETGDYITATGRCLRSILDRRIIWDQTVLNGTTENAMRRLVTDAFISPAIDARKYDKLTLAPAHGYTETVSTQYTGNNLLEAIEELCAAYSYGFKVVLVNGAFQVDFYKGVDRSTAQSDRPRVTFSEDFDTLTGSLYSTDKTNYKNVALVAGEGEGTARRRVSISKSLNPSGLDRREMFIDARDVSSNDGEIPADEYELQLVNRGTTTLYEAAEVEKMEGSIETSQMYTYGKDYSLGDIVTVKNKYGVQADAQVLEVIEAWDENGYTCTPTFG